MLSYMLPVEDKNHPPHNLNLALNLENNDVNITNNGNSSGGRNGNDSLATTATATPTTMTTKSPNQTQIIHFERHSVLKNSTGTSEAQRPKSLVKPNSQQQLHQHQHQHQQLISMEPINTDGGSSSTGSILTGSTGAGSDEGKKIKMSKIGNTKSVPLKR